MHFVPFSFLSVSGILTVLNPYAAGTELRDNGCFCPRADPRLGAKGTSHWRSECPPVPPVTMSTQRLRDEDYRDYSSTDASPEDSPSEGLNNFPSSGSYMRFGESNSTT